MGSSPGEIAPIAAYELPCHEIGGIPMLRFTVATSACLAALVLPAPAEAWKGELTEGVKTIAEVKEKAEDGDYVVVEGEVADVQWGEGNRMFVTFQDDTDSVLMEVPNHLMRHFAGGSAKGGSGPSGAEPKIGARARVGGDWNQSFMEDGTWGIRVQRVEPLNDADD